MGWFCIARSIRIKKEINNDFRHAERIPVLADDFKVINIYFRHAERILAADFKVINIYFRHAERILAADFSPTSDDVLRMRQVRE
jgi:hypothetical protein